MFKLPEGEYTLTIEFLPPSTTHLSVNVISTSLNIGQQSTKVFVNYRRSIVLLHKWSITPPKYIYIDIHCMGIASNSVQRSGHLITYKIKGALKEREFLGAFSEIMKENGIKIWRGRVDIHRDWAIVEPFNGTLAERPFGHHIRSRNETGRRTAGNQVGGSAACCCVGAETWNDQICRRETLQSNQRESYCFQTLNSVFQTCGFEWRTTPCRRRCSILVPARQTWRRPQTRTDPSLDPSL